MERKAIYLKCKHCGAVLLVVYGDRGVDMVVPVEKRREGDVILLSCPKCGEKGEYPASGVSIDFDVTAAKGKMAQRIFEGYWENEFQRFGTLELIDINPYESNPDYFCKKLELDVEFKNKEYEWAWIIEHGGRYGPGKVLLNYRSFKWKERKWKEHPAETHVIVTRFKDEGYKCALVSEISDLNLDPVEVPTSRGSGMPGILVPSHLFVDFEEFIRNHAKKALGNVGN